MRIYLDHNGTSPIDPDVRERHQELLEQDLGNPSSTHASGRRARAVIDDARAEIAAALGVSEESLIFTSGGTEANNLALRGALESAGPGAGLAISAIEHSSVRETARELARRGHGLTTVPVDRRGSIHMEELVSALRSSNCRLLSIMMANNEVGAVAPMAAIAEFLDSLGAQRPLWHSDGVQALGKIPLQLSQWQTDLVSFSAHKVGGPLGVGFLIRRPGADLAPLLIGGDQESGLRAGTENAAGIGATALAVRLACERQESYAERVSALTATLWEGLRRVAPGLKLLGPKLDAAARLPNTLNVLLEGVDGRTLIARLDLEGVEASLGSACSSGAIEPSHVLMAMGLGEQDARAGLRLSLGWCTTSIDIHRAVDAVGKVLDRLA